MVRAWIDGQSLVSTTHLTRDDFKAFVASLRDIPATLARADPDDKAALRRDGVSPSPTTKTAGYSSGPGLV